MNFKERLAEAKFLYEFGVLCKRLYLKHRSPVMKQVMIDTKEILEDIELYPNKEKEVNLDDLKL